jgi:hypothetical protein
MMKSLLVMAFAILGVQASASANNQTLPVVVSNAFTQHITANVLAQLPWQVGETADYKLSSDNGIIAGSVHMQVREMNDQGFWIQQDMDMGFLGKQKVEVLYDKSTGKVLEMMVNGEKQTPPDPNDSKVVETKNDHITVPKGEYDCIWAKIHDNKQNTDAEVWVNPKIVPIAGMLKESSPSQLGTITLELTDFLKK